MDFPNDTTQASAYWYVLSSDFIWVEYRRGIALNIAFPHLICVPEVSQFELKGSKCEDSLANSPNVTWGILRSICTLRSKAACIQPFHLFLSDLSWNGALNRKKKYISMILTLTAPPLWCVSHWPHTAISLGTSSLSVLFFFFSHCFSHYNKVWFPRKVGNCNSCYNWHICQMDSGLALSWFRSEKQ